MIGAQGPSNHPVVRANVVARVAVQAGGVYQLDELKANAASTSLSTSLDNVITPSTAGLPKHPMLVAETDLASGIRGSFVAGGYCRVLVSGAVAVGDRLAPSNGNNYLQTATGTINVAVALGTNASGTALVDARLVTQLPDAQRFT